MPDWFYRTLARPLLFAVPPRQAQRFAVGSMAALSNLPFGLGTSLIDLLGHMRPSPTLARNCGGARISGPVGLGHPVDPSGRALKAWVRFGFGLIEVGPVSTGTSEPGVFRQDASKETITVGLPLPTIAAETLVSRLEKLPQDTLRQVCVRVWIGSDQTPAEAAARLAEALAKLRSRVQTFHVDRTFAADVAIWDADQWKHFWTALADRSPPLPEDTNRIYWVLSPKRHLLWREAGETARQAGVAGVLVESRVESDALITRGGAGPSEQIDAIQSLRAHGGADLGIIASGGIHQPAAALALLDAGANLVLIDTGLIHSGPGLPKRINEAVLHHRVKTVATSSLVLGSRVFRCSWFWTFMLGVAMLGGGLLAMSLASTAVVMPYDEVFCGLTRTQLRSLNPNLLPFMAHDRASLAGTMVTIGLLYSAFSWFGSRRGWHWCQTAVLSSGGLGFISFFLFLGFEYFDPFHAFVTAVLFQLFIQGLVGRQLPLSSPPLLELREAADWRKGQWGQLLWVIHGVGLLGAGLIICWVGIGQVLVNSDQHFLGTSTIQIKQLAPRVLPLIAHDRATLGGMLVAAGILYLLASLWGVRRGEAWLWHTLVWGGILSYVPAIGVHFVVGYIDWFHLLPAFLGAGLLFGGAALTREWMTRPAPGRVPETV